MCREREQIARLGSDFDYRAVTDATARVTTKERTLGE